MIFEGDQLVRGELNFDRIHYHLAKKGTMAHVIKALHLCTVIIKIVFINWITYCVLLGCHV